MSYVDFFIFSLITCSTTFTGICAEIANIEPRNSVYFNYEYNREICGYKALITQHHTEPIFQKIAYDFVLNSNIDCAAPKKDYPVQRLNDTRETCANVYTSQEPIVCFVDYLNHS